MSDFDSLILLVAGLFYGYMFWKFFITARRRVAYRAGRDLPRVLALIWAALWPLWMTVWVIAALALPFEKRPASLLHEPSAADRAAQAMDQRRAARKAAIEEWQERANYWYQLGKKAEAEDDQALKWLVGNQLEFLLETRPDGALTLEEQTKAAFEEQTRAQAEVRTKKADAVVLDRPNPADTLPSPIAPVDWHQVRAEFNKKVAKAPTHYLPAETDSSGNSRSIGYCNICARYRDRDHLALEGVCRECSTDLGL